MDHFNKLVDVFNERLESTPSKIRADAPRLPAQCTRQPFALLHCRRKRFLDRNSLALFVILVIRLPVTVEWC